MIKEYNRLCWGFQKAFAMPGSAAAESLPCVRGGGTALSRDGRVVLVMTIPRSPHSGDSLIFMTFSFEKSFTHRNIPNLVSRLGILS